MEEERDYIVEITIPQYAYVRVTAPSEEYAKEIAIEVWDEDDFADLDLSGAYVSQVLEAEELAQ